MDENYRKLDRKSLKCMYLENIIDILITSIIIAVLSYFLWDFSVYKKIFNIMIYVFAVYAIINLISPKFRYERYKYLLGDEEIRIHEGFIYLKYEIIPIERLHKLTIKQGPIKRIFKLSNITVMTAGGSAEIKYLTDEESKLISEKLKNKINSIAKQVSESEEAI